MILEEVPPFSFTPFFAFKIEVKKMDKKNVASQEIEIVDANLNPQKNLQFFLGWKENCLSFRCIVHEEFHHADPDWRKGDSLEVFLDTRDIKDKHYLTKFCHQFVFYPEKIDGFYAKEVTRFLMDDMHPLCDSSKIDASVEIERSSYTIEANLSQDVLYGYDPSKFKRLGFALRLNRFEKDPIQFWIPLEEYKIEKMPSLWPSIELV
jgi:hypothetical protein